MELADMTEAQYAEHCARLTSQIKLVLLHSLSIAAEEVDMPRVAVIAALAEVAAASLDDNEPLRTTQITGFCRYFVEMATGKDVNPQ